MGPRGRGAGIGIWSFVGSSWSAFSRERLRRVLRKKTSAELRIIYIFTSSHLHIYCTSLLIFTSAHLHLCSSSSSHIYISAHVHICTSTSLLIFTSSHHLCSSSHPHIYISHPHLSLFLTFSLKAGGSAAGPPRNATLCGDRACRVREMQARVRFGFGVGCFQFLDWCFPFPWCFLFPDWFFRFPWCFWFPGLGVFSSWIGVFLAQLLCWCFWFPGLGVFSPGQCVPCPAPVLVCPFTCLFVSFRLNFWLPLPTAGFESTYLVTQLSRQRTPQSRQSHSL